MSTGSKPRNKILGVIMPSHAENLLVSLANLKGSERMRALYSDVVGSLSVHELMSLRDELRLVWDTQDRRHRDWYLFRLRDSFQHDVILGDVKAKGGPPNPGRLASRLAAPPEITPFEGALFYFQTRLGELARHCGNATCPAPYFIAKKKWQKYCSPECAGPATRESKRQWWREHRAKNGASGDL
jgi:hypothetical protein